MGFPSSHQLKSYVASKSRLKLAARAVLSADAGLLVTFLCGRLRWPLLLVRFLAQAAGHLLSYRIVSRPSVGVRNYWIEYSQLISRSRLWLGPQKFKWVTWPWSQSTPIWGGCHPYANTLQVSAVADEPARRAASRPACCKQRWTLSVINFRLKYVDSTCDSRSFRAIAGYLLKVANFNIIHLHLAPPLGWSTPFEFCRDLRHQKTRIPGLSCGVVCVNLHLAVSVERQLVTDRQTDIHIRHIPR